MVNLSSNLHCVESLDLRGCKRVSVCMLRGVRSTFFLSYKVNIPSIQITISGTYIVLNVLWHIEF